MESVAVFTGNIYGSVVFSQKKNNDMVEIYGQLKGFDKFSRIGSKHGIHIHSSGDLRQGCKSACDHFNPFKQKHGGLLDKNSHAGDLGNIVVGTDGFAHFKILTPKISLFPGIKNIIGRTLIIHLDEDDLGRGHHHDSSTTGHSGERIACAIIGISQNSVNCK